MTELDHLDVSAVRHHSNLPNGGVPHHVNGITYPQVAVPGGGGGGITGESRSVHDGFATIRSGGGKRGRCKSTPTISADPHNKAKCCGCNSSTSTTQEARMWKMEPLWEEKTAPGVVLDPSGVVNGSMPQRRQKTIPWWEVATRRSKYRSCPAFSQANVVSALEQTVSNVTSQLEKLASSPDLKEAEAEELRRTAAVLREQSSAVYQSLNSSYFTMERQLSCDSVSSVTSTLSGTSLASYASLGSHHHPSKAHHLHHNHAINSHHQPQLEDQSKIKKRNWLRSSFRRAFSRRKRSKQCQEEGMNNVPSPMACNNLPTIPPSHQNGHHTLNNMSQRRNTVASSKTLPRSPMKPVVPQNNNIISQSAINNHTNKGAMDDLQLKLLNKERELTDCHLELLSAKHLVQSHEDTIQRLQAEVGALRNENARLSNIIASDEGPIRESVIAPLTQAINNMTLSRHSTGNSISRDNGRDMKVVVLEGVNLRHVNEAKVSSDVNCVRVGKVSVMPSTTWSQLDQLISEALRNFCLRVDPGTGLGINGVDILCYCLDEVLRGDDQHLPELLPYGYCVGNVDRIHVWLKNGYQKTVGASVGCVSSCAFTSGIPASWLRDLLGSLQETKRLVLAGPPASGKSVLAKALASLYVTSAGEEVNQSTVSVFKVNGNNTLELCQLLSSVWPHGLGADSSKSSKTNKSAGGEVVCFMSTHSQQQARVNYPPVIIIIDDLHAAGGVVETLQRCLPSSASTGGPAVIATTNPIPSVANRLQVHCNFRWANLGVLQEPLRGFLGRTMRRKIVAVEEQLGACLPRAHHTAEWLTQLWLHINTLLSTHLSTDAVLGPGLLTTCPVDQAEAQAWFTQAWNNTIVPQILEIIQATPTFVSSWTDPVEWIMSTYPWTVTAAIGPNQLLKIHSEDIIRTTAANRSITSALRSYQLSSNWQQNRGVEAIYATPISPPQGVMLGSGTSLSSSASNYAPSNPQSIAEITIKPTISLIKPSSNTNSLLRPAKLNLNNGRSRSCSTSSSSSSFTSSTVKTNSCGPSPTSDLDHSPKLNDEDDDDMSVDIKELFNSGKQDEDFSCSKSHYKDSVISEEIELKNNVNNTLVKGDYVINTIPNQSNTIKEVTSNLTSTFKSI